MSYVLRRLITKYSVKKFVNLKFTFHIGDDNYEYDSGGGDDYSNANNNLHKKVTLYMERKRQREKEMFVGRKYLFCRIHSFISISCSIVISDTINLGHPL